jgi:hypothetical protein
MTMPEQTAVRSILLAFWQNSRAWPPERDLPLVTKRFPEITRGSDGAVEGWPHEPLDEPHPLGAAGLGLGRRDRRVERGVWKLTVRVQHWLGASPTLAPPSGSSGERRRKASATPPRRRDANRRTRHG